MQFFESEMTQFVQLNGKKHGAISPSVIPSAAFGYGDSETAEGIFDGSVKKPLYARMGNPSSAHLEALLCTMDGAAGAIATSSGMGAISLATLSLLQSGDEVISIGGLFGGTYALFNETLERFGITTHFFDVDELQAIESAISEKTKIIYCESVGNPNMRLPDLAAITALAKRYKIVTILDNTVTPLSIKPLEIGFDIVVYSTTKVITGNASALGGAVLFRAVGDNDALFKNSQKYPFMGKFIEKMGKMALLANAKKRALRDFGMSANAFASYLTALGFDTLALRQERIVQSVGYVAQALHKAGLNVNHPSLPEHPHHERYNQMYAKGCGSLLTLDFGTKERAFSFLNSSSLITITANIGDSRTLGLHMASTIYRDFSSEQREFLGITPGLVRISIGLEDPKTIVDDFIKANT